MSNCKHKLFIAATNEDFKCAQCGFRCSHLVTVYDSVFIDYSLGRECGGFYRSPTNALFGEFIDAR